LGDGITQQQIQCGQWLSRFGIHWVVTREADSVCGLSLPINVVGVEGRSPMTREDNGQIVALEDEWLLTL
jgi:hypothetical protein